MTGTKYIGMDVHKEANLHRSFEFLWQAGDGIDESISMLCVYSLMRIRIPVMRLKIGLFALAWVLASQWTVAQESNYLDLTDPLPREPLRVPQSGSGDCGGGPGFTANSEATITLLYLDKLSYLMGEDVTFEVKVQNSGKEAFEIPWTPHLGDLEPSDATETYSYMAGAVSLNFEDPISHHRFAIFGNFYGSASVPGSLRKLEPGQWALIRVRTKIEVFEDWWSTRPKDSQPLNVTASANLLMSRVTYVPGSENGSATQHSTCVPFPTKEVTQLDVMLWPREQQ